MWGFHEGMGWWWVLGGMWMLAFWAIIIGLVVWGVKQFTGGGEANRTPGDTPLEIAQKRLARGDLGTEAAALRGVVEITQHDRHPGCTGDAVAE